MKTEELRELHDIFNDCWQLLKSHADITDDPAYWDDLIACGDAVWRKHDKHLLSLLLTSAIGEYLDKEYQKKKKRRAS